MSCPRPPAVIAAFLIIAVSVPPSFFSQPAPKASQPKPSQSKPAASRPRQPERSRHSDALAPAIKELLETEPRAPKSPGEEALEENASQDEKTPPADDATIDELLTYWTNRDGHDGRDPALKPSDRVRQRLLEAGEERPEFFESLMDYLPENTDTHDRLYQQLNEGIEDENSPWKYRLHAWLRRNTAYFRDDLIVEARRLEELDSPNDDLRALARLDWNMARPILERSAAAGKALATPFAFTLLYEHARQEGDSAQLEFDRAWLKAFVENRQASWTARKDVLASLMTTEWSGQEEWFISLFADPTLSSFPDDGRPDASAAKSEPSPGTETAQEAIATADLEGAESLNSMPEFHLGILAIVLNQNTRNVERWLPVISNLIGHHHRTVHQAAVKCLVKFLTGESNDKEKQPEIARKLIPLLTDPNWATEEDRDEFIGYLTGVNLPELTPGLIWILDYDQDSSNRAMAAEALTKYRDPRAVPALRRALEKEAYEKDREQIVTALAASGGLSDDEMAAAIEAYARMVVTGEWRGKIKSAGHYGNPDFPLEAGIGRILTESETIEVTEGLAIRLIDRARALRAIQPAVSLQMLSAIEGAPLRVAEINLVERLGEGWADVDSITSALETRDTLSQGTGAELSGLIKAGGYAAGVAAAILNDQREWTAVLEQSDARAQLALLACARYLRDKLPVELAGKLLNSPNRALADAAAGYLEIEDGAEARRLIFARHPGETYILGDLTAVSNDVAAIDSIRDWEDALRKEMQGRSGPEAIYAAARADRTENLSGVVVRVRGGKAELSIYEIEGRREIRGLTDSEFDELKSFASRPEIEDLGPEIRPGNEGASYNYEYLRLTKAGGRRIVLNGLRRAPGNPSPHEELSGLFYRLSRSGEFTTRYEIQDKIPGVEVVFADKKQTVSRICAEGGELRALIDEPDEARYRQETTDVKPKWRDFSSGRPGEVRDEPSACPILNDASPGPNEMMPIRPGPYDQPARADGAKFYYHGGKRGAIWKSEPGKEPVKIASGDYSSPIITPDARWLVAVKWVVKDGQNVQQLIRHNLQNSREFIVQLPQNDFSPQLHYLAAQSKVFVNLHSGGALLDPETGTVQQAKGEFRPLTDYTAGRRRPQSAGAPNLFWVAFYDGGKGVTAFGQYDVKNLVFTPLPGFSKLTLDIDDVWVDAGGGKLWFVYRGHLLRLPLPLKAK